MVSPNTKRNNDAQKDDLYSTPLGALEAAYDKGVFDEFNVYYDPCNGLGDISEFLRSKGKKVYTSDILDYGIEVNDIIDFLEVESIPEDVECIVFNPPFSLTEEFIDKALSLCPKLLMFNRATVLETGSRSRKHYYSDWSLDTFYSFGYRVSCTKGINREKTNNAVWYGWFYYNKDCDTSPTIDWFIK